jgi:hypothetical protein
MSTLERIIEQATDLARELSADSRQRAKRRRKRRRRLFIKIVKTGSVMMFATIAIVVGMIAGGWLLGPSGAEGWLALPCLLFATWAMILYVSFGRKAALPKPSVKLDLAQLPSRTEEWLEQQRRALPPAAQRELDSMTLRLEALAPQLQALDPQASSALEVRRLLGEELPELVRGYRKVPPALQRQPLHGGASPDQRLVEGLVTIGEEIDRMHARLAADDLHALATQQRYLEVKYKDGGKL